MNLSISNIGWSQKDDEHVYALMLGYGFSGLEIAPTRIFANRPYDNLESAIAWKEQLRIKYGFSIPSIQSIWYGRQERLFGSKDEREILLSYTQKAVDFAEAIGCRNLVFGCPRNRYIQKDEDMDVAVSFFKSIGDYAYEHQTVIAMEANPPIYNTNFINTTEDAIELIKRVGSKGFLLNLDIGTMIENMEDTGVLRGNGQLINHVHISEPGLKLVQKRRLHIEIAELLREMDYSGFVSIEIGRQDDMKLLAHSMGYVRELFG